MIRLKVRHQIQACACRIEIPVGVKVSGKMAVNEYLRMLLCGYRPHYMPMVCPHCKRAFDLKITTALE